MACRGPVRQQPLPTHEFQRVDLWVVDERVDRELRPDPERLALPGERTDATAAEWEIGVSVAALPWIDDHVVAGMRLLPGAAYLDAALSAAHELTGRATSMPATSGSSARW
ncbi:MAG: polyketide synthase dehydratase domain-containing protein [Kineosporiaceae bacterium]|nr:polyketide synthase dehydratase domain-containing protein [Kineosporiaceae bacterium]